MSRIIRIFLGLAGAIVVVFFMRGTSTHPFPWFQTFCCRLRELKRAVGRQLLLSRGQATPEKSAPTVCG